MCGSERTIRAAVVDAPGQPFNVRDVTLEAPREDEILVKIAGVGLCHTDIAAQAGAFGYTGAAVLGHEGAGVVEQVGRDVEGFAVGDRVAISFRSCGTCKRCQAGFPSYCATMPMLNYAGARPDGSTPIRDGEKPVASSFFGQSSFATHALTYARNLVHVPGDLPLELAGPLGCGIQTGAGAIMRSMACEAGSHLVVTGGGSVGLSAVMGAAIQRCASIIVVEPYAGRRELAREFGATHVIDPLAEDDLAAAIRAIVPEGADYALDTTGRPDTIASLIGSLAPRGLLGLVGIAPPGTPLPAEVNMLMTFGHRVMGIIEGDSDPAVFIPELIGHHRAGRLPFDRMIRTYPLSRINEAVRDQHEGRCIKAVLIPDLPAQD